MKRVLIIGSPGAGKSTFARALRDQTKLPLYYLDQIWHRADKSTVSRTQFDEELERILAQERWIIDGNYGRTLEKRLAACDTVFFLDLPLEECLKGIRQRVGIKREDLPWVEESLDEEFERYVRDFPKTKRPEILAILEKYSHKNIIVFRSRNEAIIDNQWDF